MSGRAKGWTPRQHLLPNSPCTNPSAPHLQLQPANFRENTKGAQLVVPLSFGRLCPRVLAVRLGTECDPGEGAGRTGATPKETAQLSLTSVPTPHLQRRGEGLSPEDNASFRQGPLSCSHKVALFLLDPKWTPQLGSSETTNSTFQPSTFSLG